jgi:hypothetical protein
MLTYKLQKGIDGNVCAVLRSDGWSIPIALDNTDYQAYLKWLEEGNEPEPADDA